MHNLFDMIYYIIYITFMFHLLQYLYKGVLYSHFCKNIDMTCMCFCMFHLYRKYSRVLRIHPHQLNKYVTYLQWREKIDKVGRVWSWANIHTFNCYGLGRWVHEDHRKHFAEFTLEIFFIYKLAKCNEDAYLSI